MKKVIMFLLVLIIAFVPILSFASTTINAVIPDDGLNYYIITRHFVFKLEYPLIASSIDAHVFIRDEEYKPFAVKKYNYSGTLKYSYDRETSYQIGYQADILAANYDIPIRGSSEFFFMRPKVSPLIQAMEGVHSGMILKTILNGLTLLVGLLVLGICLRKGWAFLRRQLTT